jgi:hypothetical protein
VKFLSDLTIKQIQTMQNYVESLGIEALVSIESIEQAIIELLVPIFNSAQLVGR